MRPNHVLVAVAFGLALFFAGCGNASQTSSGTSTVQPTATPKIIVDSVHVVRISDMSNVAPLDKTGKTAGDVQALFDALRTLPPYVPNSTPCQLDKGVLYQMTFTSAGANVYMAVADPSGCQVVVLEGHDNRVASSTLWKLIAQAIAVQETDIYPLP